MPKAKQRPQPQDDWFPLDPSEHNRQLRALARMLGKAPKRALDLGVGDGRTAAPLAALGHHLLGVDRDPAAVSACKAAGIDCLRADFASPSAASQRAWKQIKAAGPFHAAVCLGNTFLTVADPHQAAELLRQIAPCLRKGAPFIIDDFSPLWREVAEGYWQEGLSDDRTQQLVWAEGDNLIAVRRGKGVKPSHWSLSKSDTPLRLWSRGELSLLAAATGWKLLPPRKDMLSVFERA